MVWLSVLIIVVAGGALYLLWNYTRKHGERSRTEHEEIQREIKRLVESGEAARARELKEREGKPQQRRRR